ncbi:MAG: hypothetical protein ACE5F6_00675 [Anaerolineae bacterium]
MDSNNYDLILTSWGFAGVAAGRIGAQVDKATGAYDNGFYISRVLVAVAVILMFVMKKPAARAAASEA